MFSSLSNFIPNALRLDQQPPPPQQPLVDAEDDDDDEDTPNNMTTDDTGTKNSKSKAKSANETFIFVRPPPAKSNHPLNLQVQLVPPHSKGPGGLNSASTPRQSLDGAAPDNASGTLSLTRTASNRSDTSTVASSYGSTASFASVGSTASGRRMIIPLYNLQAHNVLTNTIVDAGTDAKIAKFTKKGLEMIDLAVLEPVEVWSGAGGVSLRGSIDQPSRNSAFLLPPPNANSNSTTSSRPTTPDPQLTPGSSALSISSAGLNEFGSQEVAPVPTTSAPATSKRNLFGKLFKKKEGTPTSTERSSRDLTQTTPTQSRGHARTTSLTQSFGAMSIARKRDPSPMKNPASPPSVLSVGDDPEDANQALLLPATLGLTPTLQSNLGIPIPPYPPKLPRGFPRGPRLYVWIVRRWIKGNGSGFFSSIPNGANLFNTKEGNGVHGREGSGGAGMGKVELRVEWRRGKAKAKKDKVRRNGGSGIIERGSSSRPDSILAVEAKSNRGSLDAPAPPPPGEPSETLAEKALRKRFSVISAASTNPSVSEDGLGASPRPAGGEDDDGSESDPEDSETPWSCTLRLRRTAPRASSSTGSGPRGASALGGPAAVKEVGLKIKLGTLSPTPHHPKVVAMLKVPYPLPDVEVEKMGVVWRGAKASNAGAAPGGDSAQGLLLTAEEIKDVICSTGMWLVVREGFGGVGKISRKGDGWRIRA